MSRWTMKELSTLNSFDFAGAILLERRGSLNPYMPLYKKLSESRVEILAAGERERLCFECESKVCVFNHGGMCRFARVHERMPDITEEDGCLDFDM